MDYKIQPNENIRRRLKKIGSRENRWMNDVNHCVSKALVTNNPSKTLFVLEDLTGIRGATEKVKRKDRYVSVSWSYYDLEQKLKYNHENRKVDEDIIVKCQYCGKEFVRGYNSQVYCSDDCSKKAFLDQQAEYSRKRRKSIKNGELVTNERVKVGTNYLSSHPREDFDEEQAAIWKEMKRLKLRR